LQKNELLDVYAISKSQKTKCKQLGNQALIETQGIADSWQNLLRVLFGYAANNSRTKKLALWKGAMLEPGMLCFCQALLVDGANGYYEMSMQGH